MSCVRLVLASWLAAMLVCASVPRTAHADDDAATAAAKRHFYRGQKLFDLRRFKPALEAYEAAYEAKPLPAFLFNIGQCHYNLGDYESALFSYRRFLKLSPNTPKREAVLELIDKLERELAESRRAAQKRRNGGIEPVPSRPPPPVARPIYKRWWFWTGLAVVGAASAAAIVSASGSSGIPGSDLGNLDFRR